MILCVRGAANEMYLKLRSVGVDDHGFKSAYLIIRGSARLSFKSCFIALRDRDISTRARSSELDLSLEDNWSLSSYFTLVAKGASAWNLVARNVRLLFPSVK